MSIRAQFTMTIARNTDGEPSTLPVLDTVAGATCGEMTDACRSVELVNEQKTASANP